MMCDSLDEIFRKVIGISEFMTIFAPAKSIGIMQVLIINL